MEFDLIEALRARTRVARGDVALGIGDDAALLEVPNGMQLVACTDTLVAGVHFVADTAPADLGWKSLAVNLSDLAAMGAEPAWALLAMTLPEADEAFVAGFGQGFAELAARHRVALVGGDTTEGPLTITVTALGMVPTGEALTRSGAHAGEAVFVTGALGDAAGALRFLRDSGIGIRDSDQHAASTCRSALFQRMLRPGPRVAAGLALRGLASACIDVSDGLLADLGHVCTASRVGAEVEIEALPVSEALRAAFDEASCRELALAGGDDYELCFTAPGESEAVIMATLAQAGCRATRIGRITAGSGIRVLDARGRALATPRKGWEHFSEARARRT